MTDIPGELHLYTCIWRGLNRRQVARLYRRLGWDVRKSGWAEYEMTCPFAELEVQAESPVLLHGVVAGGIANVERVLAPLREAGAEFTGECYDKSGKLLMDYGSGTAKDPSAPVNLTDPLWDQELDG
jgi:hypothetical protein